MRKKLLPVFLACFLLAAGLLSAVSAADDEIVAKGDCGDNVKWALDNKGTLTISGTGAVYDYGFRQISYSTYISNTPWYDSHNAITALTVSDGVTEIGAYAFYGLDRLSKVTLPDSLIRVKEGAFKECSSVTKITLPDSVHTIEDSVFAKCSNLVNFIIPDGVTSIGNESFWDCDHLTNVVVPQSVESMGVSAFSDCDRLKTVKILGNIPVIKKNSFWTCFSLVEITIPDSVMIVEDSALINCSALADVYYTGTEDMWKEVSVDGNNQALANATIHYDTSSEAGFRIDALTVSDSDGKPLSAIPNGVFFATVSVTNRAFGTSPLVVLAAYAPDGTFEHFAYAAVREPIGATTEVTWPVDNSAGNIAQMKAFVVSSFSELTPLGASVSFP